MGSPTKNGETINLQIVDDNGSFKNKRVSLVGSEEDYDPHEHRVSPNATTNTETLIHLLKGSLGTGILAMPQGFAQAGLVNGTISTIVIGIIVVYCLHVLVKSQYILCKRKRVAVLTYPQSMKVALEVGPECLRKCAPAAPAIVDTFLITYQMGICCVYIVFTAENVKQIADYYIGELDVKLHCLILLIPFIAINSIRNLKLLAPFSQLANLITLVGICLILVYILDDIPPISDANMLGNIRDYPLFFGTTLFALEAVGVIIALENNMKTPGSFGGTCGVLNIGMTAIVFLYVLMGFLGYIKYGALTQASITLNLPHSEIMAQSIRVMFAVAVFISYGLQAFVPVEIFLTRYLNKQLDQSEHKVAFEYGVRIAVVLVTFVFAVAIPRLGMFISLVGALCLSALGLAFPAIIELCAKWPNDLGRFKHVLIKDILLILFGIVGLVVGTYTSVSDIIMSFM